VANCSHIRSPTRCIFAHSNGELRCYKFHPSKNHDSRLCNGISDHGPVVPPTPLEILECKKLAIRFQDDMNPFTGLLRDHRDSNVGIPRMDDESDRDKRDVTRDVSVNRDDTNDLLMSIDIESLSKRGKITSSPVRIGNSPGSSTSRDEETNDRSVRPHSGNHMPSARDLENQLDRSTSRDFSTFHHKTHAIDRDETIHPGTSEALGNGTIHPGTSETLGNATIHPGTSETLGNGTIHPGTSGTLGNGTIHPGTSGTLGNATLHPGTSGTLGNATLHPGSSEILGNTTMHFNAITCGQNHVGRDISRERAFDSIRQPENLDQCRSIHPSFEEYDMRVHSDQKIEDFVDLFTFLLCVRRDDCKVVSDRSILFKVNDLCEEKKSTSNRLSIRAEIV
jgi:hypothetical protein